MLVAEGEEARWEFPKEAVVPDYAVEDPEDLAEHSDVLALPPKPQVPHPIMDLTSSETRQSADGLHREPMVFMRITRYRPFFQ